jgi:hypothetical protein
MITGDQIRQARKLLGWPSSRLAQRAKVHSAIALRTMPSPSADEGRSCGRTRQGLARLVKGVLDGDMAFFG